MLAMLIYKCVHRCSMYNTFKYMLANNHEINFSNTKLPRRMKYNGGGVDRVRPII